MAKNRIKIESVDSEGKEVVAYIKLPDSKDNKKAQLAYNKAFKDALQSGAVLRQKLSQVMEEQGIWNEQKQEQYESIIEEISDGEKALGRGGISLKEARELALKIQEKRVEFRALISERNSMDNNTAEGQADNERFSYLVYLCLYNQNGKQYFSNIEDYEENASQPFVVKAAGQLAEKIYGLDPDYDKNLPENKFLRDYNLSDDELNLINEDGHRIDIDEEGIERLIDENGRFIAYDEDGESYYVNRDGEKVDAEGEVVQEFSPFLDDSGKPVPVPSNEEEKPEEEEVAEKPKTTRKRTTRKAKAETTTE
tara:strand:+ start:55 stop:984 length:930 start_codon:yes stop_codon:yes gene_type:complete